jgi:hypothetical protein
MKLKLSANFRALLLLLTGACLIGGKAQADTAPSVAVVAAVADRDRPESDRNRDSARKPAETLHRIDPSIVRREAPLILAPSRYSTRPSKGIRSSSF